MLRAAVEKKTPLGLEAKAAMDKVLHQSPTSNCYNKRSRRIWLLNLVTRSAMALFVSLFLDLLNIKLYLVCMYCRGGNLAYCSRVSSSSLSNALKKDGPQSRILKNDG